MCADASHAQYTLFQTLTSGLTDLRRLDDRKLTDVSQNKGYFSFRDGRPSISSLFF